MHTQATELANHHDAEIRQNTEYSIQRTEPNNSRHSVKSWAIGHLCVKSLYRILTSEYATKFTPVWKKSCFLDQAKMIEAFVFQTGVNLVVCSSTTRHTNATHIWPIIQLLTLRLAPFPGSVHPSRFWESTRQRAIWWSKLISDHHSNFLPRTLHMY